VNRFEVGLALTIGQYGPERTTARWIDIRDMAVRAETLGFDTVWIPDELLWLPADGKPQGAWECSAILGAIAASTTRIKIGSWVLSALHRNPGITAKIAETVDEVSGGRFVFGLGAGHTGPGQAHAFGLPEDATFARFEEALQIILPLVREGRADFRGRFHSANDLEQRPVGPRPNHIPLMLGLLGPKGIRLAARHADIWSTYASQVNDMSELGPKMDAFREACAEVGRDVDSIGRSASFYVNPLDPKPAGTDLLSGSTTHFAEALLAMRDGGYTSVELAPTVMTVESVEALAPVLELVRAG
jgi:alkanesulfonate monooxygenase SsuD/methylene tetrahydromethanopterin reductase-like flavin-dependent oxidoreductase (luciferase family)